MRKVSGFRKVDDRLRFGFPHGFPTKFNFLDDIRLLEDIERIKKKNKLTRDKVKQKRRAKQRNNYHPSLSPIIISDINYKFETGDERTYSLKGLAEARPKFLLEQVLTRSDEHGGLLYKLTDEVEKEVVVIFKNTTFFKKIIEASNNALARDKN